MAQLRIPPTFKEGLLQIATLTNEQFQELYTALENLPLRIEHHYIFDYKGLEIVTIPPDKLESIRDVLFPIYLAKETTGISSTLYVNDIVETLRQAEQDSEWTRSEDSVNGFKERLIRLLDIERPKLIAKANNVLTGHTPYYIKGRILTDIRPVFMDKVENPPQAAVLVHVLRIDYMKDDTEREFVVALDTKDIQLLIDVLERAKKKTGTLNSIISSANMDPIDIV
jgi:hypothetical protein